MGLTVRQSDLASYSRCPQQKKLTDLSRSGAIGPGEVLSMTAYGTVMHHAVSVLETLRYQKRPDALERAKATFMYYWMPENISQISPEGPVTIWAARQTYNGLVRKGVQQLDLYDKYLTTDVGKLLALEVEFNLPFEVDGEAHILHGTMDRLSLRKLAGQTYVNVEDFKGLSLDTPLPTPDGWTTMGAVRVGDVVMGADGHPTTVTSKSDVHYKPCYRLTFDDCSSVVCDSEHLWTTLSDDGVAVRDTETLRAQLWTGAARPQRHQRVPNAGALVLPEADLPIDPYVYGVWLGDGRKLGGEITKPDKELFTLLAGRGYKVGANTQHSRPNGCETHTVYGLTRQLRDAGLLGHRDVPQVYLRGSIEQRMLLLRGLMDTDGGWHKTRRRAVFTNCDKSLVASVRELVVSLGWKCSVFQVQRTGFGKTVTAWDVCFTPTNANPFALKRKAVLVELARNVRSTRRIIYSIEPTVMVATQCIQVDAPDSMYLCGEQMVPTHNTGLDQKYLRWNIQFSIYSWATTQVDFWADAWGDEEGIKLYEQFRLLARRGTWISLKSGVDRQDAGWRGPQDYARMWVAIREYVRAVKADIYPLSLTGSVCFYCPYREGICGGVSVPEEDYGRPAPLAVMS